MIFKKIQNPDKSSSKSVRITKLIDYMTNPEHSTLEKCLYTGSRHFLSEEKDAQILEMIALSSESVRSKDTVNHYVISWQEGEHPTEKQIEECVTVLMQEFGMSHHQVIYALHQDTDNLHLHVAINRVDPETLKSMEINKGFDIEAGHRAIAKMEHQQNWKKEKNARYQVLESGELARESEKAENQKKKPQQSKVDMEVKTGEKSAQRIAIERAGDIFKEATSWRNLHKRLGDVGLAYEPFGSGAVVKVGEVAVKASDVDRQASFKKLEKRLGPFEAPILKNIERIEPEALKSQFDDWQDYRAQRHHFFESKNHKKAQQKKQHEAQRLELAAQHKKKRSELLGLRYRGVGDALIALKSVLAAEQAKEKLNLKEQQAYERKVMLSAFKRFPNFEAWQRQHVGANKANEWRYSHEDLASTQGPYVQPEPKDLRNYIGDIQGREVSYRKRDRGSPSLAGEGGGGVSFVDKGQQIDIHDWRDRETTLAALQLSAQKWGTFTVTGHADYQALCVQLAAEHGFKIQNPDLQEAIQKEKDRLQAERQDAMKLQQLKDFEMYAQAVNAERYRVTSIKMHGDGSKQTFILDKKHGFTQGFEPQQLAQRIPEMLRLQNRGENLYYTPLSEHKHHILIDDMNREKLNRLIDDGFQPAVLLESSPQNYQAIITIHKLGSQHDKDIGNQLSVHLNRVYGDPKLSGCIHPHRAPGFENRKPKHQREDGSYPEVKLLRAMQRECSQTLDLSLKLNEQLEQQHQLKQAKSKVVPDFSQTSDTRQKAPADAVNAYQRHHKDVMERQQGGAIDHSRVDSMIAVRMRVTGHDQSSIESAIGQCAPALRGNQETRNWDDYAKRTAKYAFSAAGDRQVYQLDKYQELWEKLEGRHKPAPEIRQQQQPERVLKL